MITKKEKTVRKKIANVNLKTVKEKEVVYQNTIAPISSLFTISQASEWATEYLKKKVTTSNISYLIQYGRVKKFGNNGSTLIDKNEL